MRTCRKCGEIREASEFYARHATCKVCVRARVKARYHAKMTDPAWVARERERNRTRMGAKYHDELKGSPEYWDRHVAVSASYRRRHPEKYRAQTALNNAVRDGKVQKPNTCEGCGQPAVVEGHHDDYAHPLRVRWLCAKCHAAHHRQERAA